MDPKDATIRDLIMGDTEYAGWVTDRLPGIEDLKVTFRRTGYEIYGGEFWVWDGREVALDAFEKPPREEGGFYSGYWKSGRPIKAWRPFRRPDPPVDLNQEDADGR